MTEKVSMMARVWSFAVVLLGFVFGGFLLIVGLALLDVIHLDSVSDDLQDTRRFTNVVADLAVMLTAIAIWVEYLRKRRRARENRTNRPTLDDLASDVAVLRGRVRDLGG